MPYSWSRRAGVLGLTALVLAACSNPERDKLRHLERGNTYAAPYLDLPAIADDTYGRSARAYTTARYRGPHQVYGEVEYRTSLTANGLLGAVAFANAAAIDGETPDQKMFSSVAPAAGGGLRVLLSKRSRANLCADYGWGTNGSRGLYLAVRETF
jgi:hypothetical protein